MTCCLHSDILPIVVKEHGIEACEDKLGFRCVRQDVSYIRLHLYLQQSLISLSTPNSSHNEYHFPHKLQTCRNSEILVAEDTSEEDAKIIHLGIRIDTFNQTRLFQQGNLCGSVLEVCCNVNKGKSGNY